MKRIFTIPPPLIAAALLVTACEVPTALEEHSPPSFAAASQFTDNVSIPIAIGVFVPCAAGGAGEIVLLSGNLHFLFHSTVNDNGFTQKIHNQPQGVSGVGLVTGDKYQGTGVTQETFHGSFTNGQFSHTLINNFRIIGQGRGNNLLVHSTLHITFNANGELTAMADNFSAECR